MVWLGSTHLVCAVHLCAQSSGLGPGMWCSTAMAGLSGGTSLECDVLATRGCYGLRDRAKKE